MLYLSPTHMHSWKISSNLYATSSTENIHLHKTAKQIYLHEAGDAYEVS